MLFARHPAYAHLPVARTVEILDAVRCQHNFCAVVDGRLVGAILWKPLPGEVACRAIAERRLPSAQEIAEGGDARVATSFIAPSPNSVRVFWDAFIASQPGRIILFERHAAGKPSRLHWFDRTGRLKGDQL